MIQLTLLLLFVSIYSISFGQRKIKKGESSEKGFDLEIIYKHIVGELTHDSVRYKITPISPEELNTLFNKDDSYNGN